MAEDTEMQENTEVKEKENKVVVITGASSGIGMATALKFAEEGYNLMLAARREEQLQNVAAQCEEYNVQAIPFAVDVTDDEAMQRLREAAARSFDHVDVWVNNAGVYLTGKIEDLPLRVMRRVMDTNFFGTVFGSCVALQQFREQGYGTLINVSSVNASAPQPYISIYSASKAAIRAFDESLRMELILDNQHRDIRVCTVMPASIDTNLYQNSANYTGKAIRALEPVYDPEYVAKQIFKLTKWPRREIIVGGAGRMMAMQNAFNPGMYENQMSRYTRVNLLSKESSANTAGNLYEPIEANQGMHGGWREKRMRADTLNAVASGAMLATLAAIGTGYVLAKRS